MATDVDALYDLLACPRCRSGLDRHGEGLTCPSCGQRYPIIDGIVSFLPEGAGDELTDAEREARDAEAAWYDSIFSEYTDIVELTSTVDALSRPSGPVLDHGAGTGRATRVILDRLGCPVIALDYSLASLRILLRHCAGRPVLAVHADGAALPLRDRSVHGAVSAGVYSVFREADRARVRSELARVLRPDARLALTALNFNLLYRLWKLRGNTGAKEGDHLFGSAYHYVRQTPRELRSELSDRFEVERVVGVRNIPARTVANAVGRVAGDRRGDRVMELMTRLGTKVDRGIERTPLSAASGFMLLAVARPRSASPAGGAAPSPTPSAPRAAPGGDTAESE